jgi:hypothetical protein
MTADRLDALLEEIQQKQLETKADEPQPAIENEAVAATRIYVPRDAAALAVGADAVAQALQRECAARGLAVELVRNGSRGLLWLETLVEVETAQGRVAYGPVQAADVPGLLDAGMLQGQPHALCHGLTEQMPYLARQERLTFARVGIIDPLSLRDYEAHGGWQGLRAAAAMAPEAIVQQVLDSGLRGRGGAAFPAGIKWKTVAAAEVREQGRRNTLPAMPTKAIRARSPTAADGGRPVLPDRGHGDRWSGRGCDAGLYLCAQRISACDCGAERGDCVPVPRAGWAAMWPAAARRSICRCARARAAMSAAKRPPCWRASKASAALCAPSRRCPRSKACSASPRSSTT